MGGLTACVHLCTSVSVYCMCSFEETLFGWFKRKQTGKPQVFRVPYFDTYPEVHVWYSHMAVMSFVSRIPTQLGSGIAQDASLIDASEAEYSITRARSLALLS